MNPSSRRAALRSPRGLLAAATLAAFAVPLAARAGATAADHALLSVAPGRVRFSLSASGAWKSFGLRGGHLLVRGGGVVVFETAVNDGLTCVANAADGATRSLVAEAIPPTHEGVRGGVRYPSAFPDDDGDGLVDEDPLDGVDNDHDGSVDEDFAAVGDEMVVAVFAPVRDATLAIREECSAWSLTHIDGMVVTSVTVSNKGAATREGVHVGFAVDPADRFEITNAPRVDDRRFEVRGDRGLGVQPVVLQARTGSLALVLFAPRAGNDGAWAIREDPSRIVAVSPSLGDLAPAASVTLYAALVALPVDDLKAAHAILAAVRTVLGDGSSRLIPPPVPVTSAPGPGFARFTARAAPGTDPFWNTPGGLEETLLVGSPNPFRNGITIDYTVPDRAADEDGVEHAFYGSSIRTSVKVYNVAGRLVATLADEDRAPGRYRADWAARNASGSAVASGVYYVKLEIGRRSVTERLVQLK